MYRCWYDVGIDVSSALKIGWVLPEEPIVQKIWKFTAEEIFNTAWIEMCESKGIYLRGDAMLFYRSPYLNAHRAHIDVNSDSNTTWALNWVIGGKDSKMVWYDTPSPDCVEYFPIVDKTYVEWDSRNLKAIDQKHITKDMVLCRVDVPHDIMMKSESRWCISVRAWLGPKYDIMPKWCDVVDIFNELNLIVNVT